MSLNYPVVVVQYVDGAADHPALQQLGDLTIGGERGWRQRKVRMTSGEAGHHAINASTIAFHLSETLNTRKCGNRGILKRSRESSRMIEIFNVVLKTVKKVGSKASCKLQAGVGHVERDATGRSGVLDPERVPHDHRGLGRTKQKNHVTGLIIVE